MRQGLWQWLWAVAMLCRQVHTHFDMADIQVTDGARAACARFMAEVGAAEQVPLSAGGLSDSLVAQRRADALARF